MGEEKYRVMRRGGVGGVMGGLGVGRMMSMVVRCLYVMGESYFVGKMNSECSGGVGICFWMMGIIEGLGFLWGDG